MNSNQTLKRQSISLSKEDLRQLEALKEHFGEGATQVFKRALTFLYEQMLNKKE